MPDRLYFTDSDAANELIARDPMALLIGFALDQQVPVPKAFSGPLAILERIGTLDPAKLAATDLDPVFREKPAVHRFPSKMAERVHDLAVHMRDEYDGQAERVWTDARNGDQLRANIEGLPGFGEMKVKALGSVLAKRYGLKKAACLGRPGGIVPPETGHPSFPGKKWLSACTSSLSTCARSTTATQRAYGRTRLTRALFAPASPRGLDSARILRRRRHFRSRLRQRLEDADAQAACNRLLVCSARLLERHGGAGSAQPRWHRRARCCTAGKRRSRMGRHRLGSDDQGL
jgi:uncharacterized HhH-GPD family protein